MTIGPHPSEPLEAVIFDVDGTLVDSERDGHRVAFNAAFERSGLPDRWDVETYGRLLAIAGGVQRLAYWLEVTGRTPDDARERATDLHRLKTSIFREMVVSGRIAPRPGAVRLLTEIERSGAAVHVATTGTRAWVEPLLARLFGTRFTIVVTGSEVTELKPDPQVYLEVLTRAGSDPSRVIAVEDSANGLRAATAAGLACAVARNGYTIGDDMTGAAIVVDALDDPDLTRWFAERLPPARAEAARDRAGA